MKSLRYQFIHIIDDIIRKIFPPFYQQRQSRRMLESNTYETMGLPRHIMKQIVYISIVYQVSLTSEGLVGRELANDTRLLLFL